MILSLASPVCRLTAMLFLALIAGAYAWKPKTHIYLAQQVLDEVVQCDSVTIYGSDDSIIGKFAVDRATAHAIKAYPAQFRAGAIGPDGYPDILTGQMLIHPRDPGTFKWLNYLHDLTRNSSGADRAFVAGFFSHAAGDLFGHTFINHFAGGPFELGMNAIKHTVVESYLDIHLPPTLVGPGKEIAESDISIGNGIDAFIRNTMIVATPGSHLDAVLLKGARGKYSIPRIFSTLRNGLQSSIDGYYAQVSSFDRAYEEKIRAAENCALLDFSCSKTALYAEAGVIATTRAAYRALYGPIITFKEHWRDDIDAGLAALPAFSHEMAMSLFGTGRADIDRAQSACGKYVLDHLLSMAGAPDALGHGIAFIIDVIKAIVPQFIVDAIDAMKTDLFNFLLRNTIGMTVEQAKQYYSNPGLYFDDLDLDLDSYRTKELLFTPDDSTVHYMKVPPTFNTVNMIKLSMLASSELERLLRAIDADTSLVRISGGSLMEGEWFWSLDESRQWANDRNKSLRMPLANDTAAFYRVFKHQTGEDDDFPSDFNDDSTTVDSSEILVNGFGWGQLNSRRKIFESYNTIILPKDGEIDVYATPVEISLRPVALYIEYANGWLIDGDAERTGIAHVKAKNLRAGTYLIETNGEVGNVCDAEYSFPPNWWPPDTGCNLWGGFGKYIVWNKYTPQAVVDVEPDDLVESAVRIPIDSLVWRTIGYTGVDPKDAENIACDLTDNMKFDLPSGGNCVVEFASDSTVQASLEVFDPSGTRLGIGEGRFLSIPISDLDRSTCYLQVTINECGSYGAYSVIVKTASAFAYDAEPNDTAGNGRLVSSKEVVRGNLDENDRVDWYIVSTDSSGTISVSLECDSEELQTAVTVYAADGSGPLGASSCKGSRCMASWAAPAGVYHIKVSRRSGKGAYAMVVEGARGTVGAKTHYSAIIGSRKWTVASSAGGLLSITLQSPAAGPAQVSLIDMKGRIVRNIWSGRVAAGENRIRCATHGAKSGCYLIAISVPGAHRTVRVALVR